MESNTNNYQSLDDKEIEYIFRPYITVKGKKITRKNGGMFKIPIKKNK